MQGIRRVTRRGKKVWTVDFYTLNPDGSKVRVRKDAEVNSRDAAHAEYLRLATAKPVEVAPEVPRVPTFAEFWESTYVPVFMPVLRPTTVLRYELSFRMYVREFFGSMPLDQIDGLAIRRFAVQLKVGPQNPCALVRAVLRAAVESKVLASAPKLPNMWKEVPKVLETYEPAEVETLLTGTSHPLRLCIALAAFTGARVSEVLALEHRDIDRVRNRVIIRRTLSVGQEFAPKNGKERTVPLIPRLASMLPDGAGRVVTGVSRAAVYCALLAAQRRLGLPRRSFHALRHYYCTTLLTGGASVEAVRMLAGHHSITVTQRYLHATDASLDAAVKVFG